MPDTQPPMELYKLCLLLDLLLDLGLEGIGMGLQYPKSKFNSVWHIFDSH